MCILSESEQSERTQLEQQWHTYPPITSNVYRGVSPWKPHTWSYLICLISLHFWTPKKWLGFADSIVGFGFMLCHGSWFYRQEKCCGDHDSIEIFACPSILYYKLPSPGRPWNSQGDLFCIFCWWHWWPRVLYKTSAIKSMYASLLELQPRSSGMFWYAIIAIPWSEFRCVLST